MEGCEDGQLKQYTFIQFWTEVKISPINIHHHMQAVCGVKCVYVNTDFEYGSLSKKKWGEASCDKVSSGRTVTATDKSHQEHDEEVIQ